MAPPSTTEEKLPLAEGGVVLVSTHPFMLIPSSIVALKHPFDGIVNSPPDASSTKFPTITPVALAKAKAMPSAGMMIPTGPDVEPRVRFIG